MDLVLAVATALLASLVGVVVLDGGLVDAEIDAAVGYWSGGSAWALGLLAMDGSVTGAVGLVFLAHVLVLLAGYGLVGWRGLKVSLFGPKAALYYRGFGVLVCVVVLVAGFGLV